jgi:hypothetical protein
MVTRRFLLLLVLLVGPFAAYCQAPVERYEDFIVLLKSGDRIEGRNCTLTSTDFTGVTLAGAQVSYPIAQLQTLHVSAGTKAGSMALLGGAVGLASGLLAVLEAGSTKGVTVDGGKAVAVTAGLTGAGILIGAVVGAGMKTWRTIEFADSTRPVTEYLNPELFEPQPLNKKGE